MMWRRRSIVSEDLKKGMEGTDIEIINIMLELMVVINLGFNSV